MELIWISYVVIGLLAGVLGGLLGIGGGVITVPCLLYLFRLQGFNPYYVMHMAIATSLAAIIFNTIASSWGHQRKGNVVWGVFYRLAPGLILGSCLGALVATSLSGVILEVFFGLFLIALAVHFYQQRPVVAQEHRVPGRGALLGWGGLVGMLSNILGIGGGSMTVPLLTAFKIRDRQAIGTSAVTTLITTTLGAVTYLVLGRKALPESLFGFIEPAAFLILGISAFASAPLGVRLVQEVDPGKLRKIFAIVLVLTGLSLIISSL